MVRSRALLTLATFAMLFTLHCAPSALLGGHPPSGTFDAGNAVPLRHEIVLLVLLAITVAGGFAYVMGARPEVRKP